jgi:hypothetical protein
VYYGMRVWETTGFVSSETARVTAGYIRLRPLLTYKSWIPGPAISDRRLFLYPGAAKLDESFF